jgi:outer membrane protein TolC
MLQSLVGGRQPASCTVGPKYARPTVPTAPADAFKETDGWKPAQPSDQLLRGNWWEIFGDPQLNALESELTVSNQDLKVANARFLEARAMVKYNRAAQFPTISTSPGIESLRDYLVALRILSQEAQQQKEATASAQESLQIFTDRYIGGADPYLQVLTAQTIALQNERNDVDILRRRMDASVLLVKALGGGWTVSELPKTAELR